SSLVSSFVAFSPDGSTLAIGSWDGAVKLWNTERKALRRVLDTQSPRVTAVAFSNDGRMLAVGGTSLVTVWDTADYQRVGRLAATGTVRSISFSPDSRFVGVGISTCAVLWSFAPGQQPRSLWTHPHSTDAVRFSPDGQWWAIGGQNGAKIVGLSNQGKR